MMRFLWTKAFRKKSIDSFVKEDNTSGTHLLRTLTLFDLLCVGIGGTVGSGVFVVTAQIAQGFAGPGVIISWLIAGIACSFSALSYAELSCRIPSSGSSYSYVYVALGEWPAYIAAWCLSLECGLSSSAVARNWGVKLQTYLTSTRVADTGVNVFAGLLELCTVGIFYGGVGVGQLAVNVFTTLKVLLICFMIVVGLWLWTPGLVAADPAPMGVSGILRGATSCFFGYVGYDEVCCLSSEALDPKRTVPRAVLGTVLAVTLLYCVASLALVGMLDFRDIDPQAGFAGAFRWRGVGWAAEATALGELVVLPVVVLVSFLAQPRIQYAMAVDGLVPALFGVVDGRGNLAQSILYSGAVCVVLALLVPFDALADVISAGVLLCFNLTNASLLVIRLQDALMPTGGDASSSDGAEDSNELCRLKLLLGAYSALSLAVSWLGCRTDWQTGGWAADAAAVGVAGLGLCLLGVGGGIARLLWAAEAAESDPHLRHRSLLREGHFRAPLVPLTPLLGMLCNFGLVMQLSQQGLLLVLLYFAVASACYFAYSMHARWSSDRRGGSCMHAEVSRLSRYSGEDSELPGSISSPLATEVELVEGCRNGSYHRLIADDAVSPHSASS